MGREVRMVPKDWVHPTDGDDDYIPLFDSSFELDALIWDESCAKWNNGEYPDIASQDDRKMSYAEWDSRRPEESEYMPDFHDSNATHFMMYENTTEGTPISPAFETTESLAEWLFENNASAFGSQTATYESWLRVANGGYAPSAVMSHQGMRSGVEALTDLDNHDSE